MSPQKANLVEFMMVPVRTALVENTLIQLTFVLLIDFWIKIILCWSLSYEIEIISSLHKVYQ